MRKSVALLFIVGVVVGCSRQDAEVLGRIGAKVSARAGKLLTDEPNGKLVRSLPLLQPPGAAVKPGEPEAKNGSRLSVGP
jgi:hypothetical protein